MDVIQTSHHIKVTFACNMNNDSTCLGRKVNLECLSVLHDTYTSYAQDSEVCHALV
jgi:hypothetical protein